MNELPSKRELHTPRFLVPSMGGGYGGHAHRVTETMFKSRLRPSFSGPPYESQISRLVDPFSLPELNFQMSDTSLNPLETVRKYLQDRHTRRQDKEYRETSEAQRLALENERLRIAVIKEKADFLRSLNIPEDRIRAALSKHIVEPLERLDHLQDAGLIQTARAVAEQEEQIDKSK